MTPTRTTTTTSTIRRRSDARRVGREAASGSSRSRSRMRRKPATTSARLPARGASSRLRATIGSTTRAPPTMRSRARAWVMRSRWWTRMPSRRRSRTGRPAAAARRRRRGARRGGRQVEAALGPRGGG